MICDTLEDKKMRSPIHAVKYSRITFLVNQNGVVGHVENLQQNKYVQADQDRLVRMPKHNGEGDKSWWRTCSKDQC